MVAIATVVKTASAVETPQGQLFICSRCKEEKPRASFAIDRSRHNGVQRTCKSCASAYQHAWSSANRKKHNAIRSAWRKNNIAKWRSYLNGWRRSNPDLNTAHVASRRAARLQATPKWADKEQIKNIYRRARELTHTTGIKHSVDHIIPLQGRDVCGLHVEYNLQILTASENSRKHVFYERERQWQS